MDYKVSDVATKVIATDEDGRDVQLAIKATVENRSDSEQITICLQGVDAEGFEVGTTHLTGTVPVGGSQTLTRRIHMEERSYKQISRWQLLLAGKYGKY